MGGVTEYEDMSFCHSDISPEILESLRGGMREALDIIQMSYISVVEKFIYSLVKNQRKSAELSQRVFDDLWKNREEITSSTDIERYLLEKSGKLIREYYSYNIQGGGVSDFVANDCELRIARLIAGEDD